jgi:hypothetical protein
MKAINFFSLLTLVFAVFAACTDFFTTSLASWAQRDPSSLIPPVTKDNIAELIELTENDPAQSLALLKKIAGTNPRNNPVFQTAALQTAANASGLGAAIMKNVGDIGSMTEEKARAIVAGTVKNMSNLAETSKILQSILPDVNAPGFNPDTDPAWQSFVNNSSAENLGLAAAVILASVASTKPDPAFYFANFDPDYPDPGPEKFAVQLAVAAQGMLSEDSFLNELMRGLGLSK